MRLNFPPIPGVLILDGIFHELLFRPFLPESWRLPFIVGVHINYVAYEMWHYYLHHGQATFAYAQTMKTYHMQHHHKNGLVGFGVSLKFWDEIFGTTLDTRKVDKIKST